MHIVKEKRFYINLLTITIPIALQNLISFATSMMDTIMLGRADDTGVFLSASSLANQPFFILSLVCFGLAGASTVLSAQYWGKRDTASIRSIYSIILKVAFVISTLMALAVLIFPQAVMGIYSNNDEIIAAGISYLRIIGFAYILFGLSNTMICCIRSIELVKISVVVNITSFCTNVFLNWVLIFGNLGAPALGIRGAAIATVISQYISGIGLMIYVYIHYPELRLKYEDTNFVKRTAYDIAILSGMTCLQQSVMNFGILMVQGIVNSFGTKIMAAFAVSVKIDTIAYMPVQDFGNAFSTFIAQNFGAGKYDRIKDGIKKALKSVVLFCIFISAIVFIFAKPLMMIFVNAESTEIINIGVQYLRIEGACYIGIGILFMLYGYYRAINKPSMSVVLTVISLGIRVVLAYVLSRVIGVVGIWWSIPIGWFIADAVGICFYLFKFDR